MATIKNYKSKSFQPKNNLNKKRADGELVDVHFELDDRIYPAHKIILATVYDYFSSLFENGNGGKNIHLDSGIFSDLTFKPLLDYAYTGSIRLTEENAESLCKTVYTMKDQELLEVTQRYLSETLNQGNIIRRLFYAERLSLKILIDGCNEFLRKNPNAIHTSSEYLSLDYEKFKSILEALAKQSSKESIYHTIVNWVKEDRRNRNDFLERLVNMIPMDELPYPFLLNTVTKEPLITDHPKCAGIFGKALAKQNTMATYSYTNPNGDTLSLHYEHTDRNGAPLPVSFNGNMAQRIMGASSGNGNGNQQFAFR